MATSAPSLNPFKNPRPQVPALSKTLAPSRSAEMPGLASDPGDSLVPFLPDVRDPVVYPIRHGVNPPIFRVYVSWTRGNLLQVACLRNPAADPAGGEEDGVSDEEIGGKVVEVKLGAGDGEVSEAQRRRIAYGSVPAFALLQSRKNSLAAMSRMSASSIRTEWSSFSIQSFFSPSLFYVPVCCLEFF